MLGEVPKDEGEVEEPESSTQRLTGFDWAKFWVEEGGLPALAEGESQSLIIQVFSLNPLLSPFLLSIPVPCL